MFLYFHEVKAIVGLKPSFCYKQDPCIRECDDFDIKEDDDCFSGWETEENEDGTFYLAVKTQENTKYYLQQTGLNESYVHMSKKRYQLVQFCEDKKGAQKLVFDDNETIVYFSQLKKYLGIIKNRHGYFLVEKITKNDDNDFYRKVCLTETLNLNSYVLK
jgi:hypothetical protein